MVQDSRKVVSHTSVCKQGYIEAYDLRSISEVTIKKLVRQLRDLHDPNVFCSRNTHKHNCETNKRTAHTSIYFC
jgi:hypothetical protein